jgi:hypothetical protein
MMIGRTTFVRYSARESNLGPSSLRPQIGWTYKAQHHNGPVLEDTGDRVSLGM